MRTPPLLLAGCVALMLSGCAELTNSLNSTLGSLKTNSSCDRPLEQISPEKEPAEYAEALYNKIMSEPLESAPGIKTISACECSDAELLVSRPSFSSRSCATRSITVEVKLKKLETSRDWKLWYEFSKFANKVKYSSFSGTSLKIFKFGGFSGSEHYIASTSKDWKEFRERKTKQCVQKYKKLDTLKRASIMGCFMSYPDSKNY